MGNKEGTSLFIYHRNDPTGKSLKGLLYIYHFEPRFPIDTCLAHYGYIKPEEQIQDRSLCYPYLYNHEGADVAINFNRWQELTSNGNVFNGQQGDVLSVLYQKKGKGHAYIKSWVDRAPSI